MLEKKVYKSDAMLMLREFIENTGVLDSAYLSYFCLYFSI